MAEPRQGERIGVWWVVAIAVLAALLILGTILYFRMGVHLDETGGRAWRPVVEQFGA